MRWCTVCTMTQIAKTDKASVLRAAMAIVARDGLRGMSIRSVAGSLGVAPNALYHYYESRQHLEEAVAAEVAAMLHRALARACERRGPDEVIRSMAKAYMTFAREHRLLYEAIVVPTPAAGDDAVAPDLLWHFFVGQISKVSGQTMSNQADISLWALMHGMSTLQSSGASNDDMRFSSLDFGIEAWLVAAHAAAAKERDAPKHLMRSSAKPSRSRVR